MGLFDFVRKTNAQGQAKNTNNIEYLTPEGELPWGWVSRNKDFTDRIQAEFSHFMNNWINTRGKSVDPMAKYEALKSFVLYLEDAEKLCISKGECFEFWFCEILTSKDYIQKRKNELEELTANLKQ